MAGLMQMFTCRSISYFHGFCSSGRFPGGKNFEHLDLGIKNLRTYAKKKATVDSMEEKTTSSFQLSGRFEDPKWKNGTWDIEQFTTDGKVEWDAVIDAEVRRRKWLEDNPEASTNREPVIFDTSIVPWWAWVKRFHLPQAELLNGRAAMVGFFMAYVIDNLTGVGLVDQMNSFFGKLFLLIAVTCVLFIRSNEDITNLKQIVKEFNLYDKQWKATWQDEKMEDLRKD